jgi:F-type H+-transporting ATPase subunit delta
MSYAEALLELANEEKKAVEIGQELRDIRQIVDTLPAFAQILADPAISTGEREKLIRDALDGRASKLLVNFLLLCNEKGRLSLLSAIAGAYDELLDQQQGKVEVDVTVARKLSAEQLTNVGKKVGAALKRDAVVHQYVDPEIIGGLILRFQDQLIDGSVRAQLVAMRQKLLSAKPV